MLSERDFNSVFSKISLSDKVTDVFSNSQVTSFKIYRKERVLDIKLKLPDIVNECIVDDFKNELFCQVPGVKDIIVSLTYCNECTDTGQLIQKDWQNIVHSVSCTGQMCIRDSYNIIKQIYNWSRYCWNSQTEY